MIIVNLAAAYCFANQAIDDIIDYITKDWKPARRFGVIQLILATINISIAMNVMLNHAT
ncbi:hypothetical protein [Corynebacterium vitaeruminis]|uniref:hypothetical protein n=1 Tax=Corynebacterium vitaeruminis TaxID=38305 RepID=UPI0023F5727D|nr:hypothetical protein [Corynebacterium vitaeruminis]